MLKFVIQLLHNLLVFSEPSKQCLPTQRANEHLNKLYVASNASSNTCFGGLGFDPEARVPGLGGPRKTLSNIQKRLDLK